jgi:hypothetical protein
MTGDRLEALVLAEICRARLRLCSEVKRNSIGLFLLVWSDFVVEVGIGNRLIHARDPDVRRHEASIAVLPFHSRVPRIGWHLDDGSSTDLWLPPHCPEAVVAALVAHAIAQTVPTRRRLREARRRLEETGVRLSDFAVKPSYARRSAP